MKDLKVLFMGTPNFAANVLQALFDNTSVVGVVTAPDAYVGRKKVLTMCPVKVLAKTNNIPVHSPVRIRDDFEFIKELNPDIIITCAYGQIISEDILNIPRLGCFNLHGSLLPKYRGGAPIHYALLNGDKTTGITLMYMDKGMDSGDMIYKEEIDIEDNDNIETLSNKLSDLASTMIIKYLPELINKTNPREKQQEDLVSFAPIIKREDEHLDFHSNAECIINKFRALSPTPLPNFYLNGIEYKIAECMIAPAEGRESTIVEVNKDNIVIMAKDNGIKITKIKPTGKNIMNVRDFLNGCHENLVGSEVK